MQPIKLAVLLICCVCAGAALFAGCSMSSNFAPAARSLSTSGDSGATLATTPASPDAAFAPPKGTCKYILDTVKATAATLPLPDTSGFFGTITLPANNGASKAQFKILLCPGGDPPAIVGHTVIPHFLSLVGGTPVVFLQLSPLARALTFDSTSSAFSITLPSTAFPPNNAKTGYYVGGCDEAHCDVAGPVDLSIPDVVGPLPRSKDTLALATSNPLLKYAQPPHSLTVPVDHTELAFIYASPYPPQVQYRRVRGAGSP